MDVLPASGARALMDSAADGPAGRFETGAKTLQRSAFGSTALAERSFWQPGI